jgi:hypothetical protein
VWSCREGVEEVNRDRGKRSAEFTEKNFARLLIFFACCFLVKPLVPIETGSTTAGEGMRCEIYRPASSLTRKGEQDADSRASWREDMPAI